MKRNLAVDWMKGIMITIIVLHHYFLIPGFNQTYLPVEFFFCIAGYFLMDGFLRKGGSALDYTIKRVKRLYPPFFIAFLLYCIVLHNRISITSLDSFIQSLGSLSFLLTLTNGLVTEIHIPILDITWFLSILVIAGYILYALLDCNTKLTCNVLLPIFIIFGYTLIFCNDVSIQEGGIVYGFNLNLVRGFCDMSVGALICQIYQTHKNGIDKRSVWVNVLSCLSFLFFLLIMFSKECADVFTVIILPILVTGIIQDRSWLNKALEHIRGGVFSWIGTYSLEILLIHQLVMICLYKVSDIFRFALPTALIITVDFILVIICAVLLRQATRLLSKKPVALTKK